MPWAHGTKADVCSEASNREVQNKVIDGIVVLTSGSLVLGVDWIRPITVNGGGELGSREVTIAPN